MGCLLRTGRTGVPASQSRSCRDEGALCAAVRRNSDPPRTLRLPGDSGGSRRARARVRGGRDRGRAISPARRRARSSSSAPRTPSTATTPPTSRCAWRSRPASRRARSPRSIAGRLRDADGIARVDVAGPGFLNVTLAADSLGAVARTIVDGRRGVRPQRPARRPAGSTWSSSPRTPPARSPRQRPVGRRRRRAGPACWRRSAPSVSRGVLLQRPRQPDRPVRQSLLARARHEPTPEDGYPGKYIDDIAAQVVGRAAGCARPARTTRRRRCSAASGVELMFAEIKQTLAQFGVEFDIVFPRELAARLRRRGESSAAAQGVRPLYFDATTRGGCAPPTSATTRTASSSRATASRPTSPATSPTCATSAARGFDLCIYLLGADHHGYIGRLKAAAAALRRRPGRDGRGADRADGQARQGRRSRYGWASAPATSSRSTTSSTLVGVDAARYSLARSAVDAPLDARCRPAHRS